MSEEMTLRDQFAMAALQGMLAGRELPKSTRGGIEYIIVNDRAIVAYAFADAMLEARKKEAKP